MLKIDTSGMSCPQPVLMAKNAAKESNDLQVICDNNTSKTNVAKFLKSNGFNVEITESGDNFEVKAKK